MYPFIPHKPYWQALLWLGLSILVSCLDDVITKYLTINLPACQVCFWRFTLGSLILLPLIYCSHSFRTKYLFLHCIRGFLLAVAMGLYSAGLAHIKMSTVTLISFTNPIFALLLARFFLKEQILWPIWLATLLSFGTVVVIFRPTMVNSYGPVFACIGSTVIFALLDIINKQYIVYESTLALLFFSNFFAAFWMGPIACPAWQMPTLPQLAVLAILGLGSNLVLYFLLRAFALANISALAPIKYMELVVSILCGYLFFNEWPTFNVCLGAVLIVACTWFIAHYQKH